MCRYILLYIHPSRTVYNLNYKLWFPSILFFSGATKTSLRVKSRKQTIEKNDIQNRKNEDNIAEVTLLAVMTKKWKLLNFQ